MFESGRLAAKTSPAAQSRVFSPVATSARAGFCAGQQASSTALLAFLFCETIAPTRNRKTVAVARLPSKRQVMADLTGHRRWAQSPSRLSKVPDLGTTLQTQLRITDTSAGINVISIEPGQSRRFAWHAGSLATPERQDAVQPSQHQCPMLTGRSPLANLYVPTLAVTMS